MKKKKYQKSGLIDNTEIFTLKKSKQEGFRSRAVYKLQEINDKHKVLKNGLSVIDLGAAPGGWSQFVIKNIKIVNFYL